MSAPRLCTVGHGARSAAELLQMLAEAGCQVLVDVRAHPRSRRHPQFDRDALAATLATAGIEYRWQGRELGGFRRPRADSPNVALDAGAFRGYADHLGSAAGQAALASLAQQARGVAIAILCAERDPAQCHRSLIADALTLSHGVEVVHLLEPGRSRGHRVSAAARSDQGRIVYDRAEGQLPLLPEG